MTLTDLFRDVEGGLYRGGYSRPEKPSEFAAFRHVAYSRSIRSFPNVVERAGGGFSFTAC
jgi:hypothetical protein